MLQGAEADLVVGHTHWPLERRVGSVHVVNDGSLSHPYVDDPRASYVCIEADERGYKVQFRRVAYDRQAAIQAVRDVHHPSGDFIVDWLSARHGPWWQSTSGHRWAGFPAPATALP